MEPRQSDRCRWADPRLALLAGGDLLGAERRRAERHVASCPPCRARLERLRAAIATLHLAAASPRAPEPSLWPEVERLVREARRPTSTPWLARLPWPATALAASTLLTITTLLAVSPRGRPTSPTVRPVASAPVADLESAPSDETPRAADLVIQIPRGSVPPNGLQDTH